MWGGDLEGYQDTRESYVGTRFRILRAVRSGDGAAVVLKTLRADLPDRATARARLEHEHEVAAQLDLPGVLRPAALLRVDGDPVLVSPDAGTVNLKEWLRRRTLAPAEFLDLASELCAVVAAMHGRGVIHGDLTPFNIVVGAGERLTVVDLEAARAAPGAAPLEASAAEGPHAFTYLAPEQTGRMSRPVDRRADLYALGAIFYELLTGAPPFAGSDPVELVHAHLARAPVPPAQVDPRIPPLLSALVCKLLAKMPEARYQSAAGLLADLNQARAALTEHGTVGAFELGMADLARELPIPATLYGRDPERAELARAWARAGAGARELLVLTGPAGIGKSALAADLGRQAAATGAWFATGTFDMRTGGTPYRALAEATRQLARAILARPHDERAGLTARISEALGPMARVLIEVVPELEPVVAPPPGQAPGEESASRFAVAFAALIGALADRASPVLLFIDDLQRADRASLELLRTLAATPELRHVLVVATYRTDEVAARVPRTELERALASGDGTFREVPLEALGLDAVLALVCATLRCPPAEGRGLAELLQRKTAGNPLFTRRLLRHLHARGLIALDPARGTWTWDAAAIETVSVSENVVELLIEALRRLPERTRAILAAAACIGKKVRLSLVAAVVGESPAATAEALAPAANEGLFVPLERGPNGAAAELEFAHDRVQQASDAVLDPAERPALHLRIGRCLLEETREQPGDERIFAIVDHLSLASERLTAAADRTELAELCLRAGRKARASSAYEPALEYLQRGIALLPGDAWRVQHRLAFLLHREAIACAQIAGQQALGEELFARALASCDTRLEKAELCNSWIVGCLMNLLLADAIKCGREAMRLFGTELPSGDYQAAIAAEMAAIERNLAGRRMDDLLAAPPMSDPEALVQLELLSNLRLAAHSREPMLNPFIQARIVNLSLLYGNAPLTPSNYVGHGVLLSVMTTNHRLAYDFGRIGVELANKLGDPAEECRAIGVFSGNLAMWFLSLQGCITLARTARRLGLAVGLGLWANGAALMAMGLLFHQGSELPRLLAELDGAVADARKARAQAPLDALRIYRQAIRCLLGVTRARGSFEDDDFDERTLLAKGDLGMSFVYTVRRLEICYLLGNLGEARAQAAAGAKIGKLSAWGLILVVEHNFYSSLVHAADAGDADEARRRDDLAVIAANQRQMKIWADNAPDNYRSKYLLVEAEVARLEGRSLEAAELYDLAIAAAARADLLRETALGNELAARFYHRLGRTRIAGLYLAAALRLYAQWGAKAKVDALEEEFPDHLASDLPGTAAMAPPSSPVLDHLTLFRAAEAIASELGKGRLVGRLTEVCLASAGAERAVFVLEDNDAPIVCAVARVDEPARLTHTPLGESDEVPIPVVQEVRRTGAALVLADAGRQGAFQRDAYIIRHGVRSVLALPIRRQAELVGVLYLENNLADRVFTPDRVHLLQLLSAQIAISLESSKNFEALTREVEERKRAEAKVRFLAEAGAALTESLDYEGTLARVARMAVPFLADWCLVDVLEDGALRRVAAAHHDPGKERLLHEIRERQAAHGAPSYGGIVDSETPILEQDVWRTLATYVKDPEVFTLLRKIGAHSSIAVPLRARGRPIGLLMLVSGSADRTYAADDVALAQELGRRAATAIDNARLYRESQAAVRVRDDFLSVASHELRTPLAAFLLSVQSMGESAKHVTDATLRTSLALAERQGQRLTRLVDDLLDTVRIERGVLPIRTERVDLATLVREAVARFKPQLDRARCTLRLEVDDDVVGVWDPPRLEQVLLNLLSNAAKFGADGEIVVRVTRLADAAELTVVDHGIGIDPARQARIFDRFDRAVSAQHYGGLGLGLFISRNLVEALGGTIRVQSQLGQGATFVVTLPYRRDDAELPLPPPAGTEASASS